MQTKVLSVSFVVLLSLLGLPAAKTAQGTVSVKHERHVIPGFVEPNTPGAPGVSLDPNLAAVITDPAAFEQDGSLNLNKAIYVRFFDENRTAPPDAILVLIPGVVSGANSYRIVASEILRLSGGRFEVWAIDRRSNLMENLLPMIESENAMTKETTLAALSEYVDDPAGRGGLIAVNPTSVSGFMSEWGLDVHLRDFKAVVDQARTKTANVFLGGHSLGAILTQMFAAYNFGGVAGFELVKGLIILDGTADPNGLGARPVSDNVYLDGGESPFGEIPGLNQLRTPMAPEHAPFVTDPFNPFLFQLLEIGSQLVLIDPNAPSVFREIVPDFIPVPMTNRAAIGINLDDEFQEQIFARFSIGFLQVPPGKRAEDVATKLGDDPSGANRNGHWAAKDLTPALQQWDPLMDLSSLGMPLGPEVSNFETVVRAFLLGKGNQTAQIGDTNFLEWYFPVRLVLDIAKVIDLGRASLSATITTAMMSRGGNTITLTENRRVNKPLLAVRAKEGGFVPTNIAFNLYITSTGISVRNATVRTMENYAHADVLTSLQRRSTPENKNVPELIVDFVGGNL